LPQQSKHAKCDTPQPLGTVEWCGAQEIAADLNCQDLNEDLEQKDADEQVVLVDVLEDVAFSVDFARVDLVED